jgi:SNF2 family DNA or RNA helicase
MQVRWQKGAQPQRLPGALGLRLQRCFTADPVRSATPVLLPRQSFSDAAPQRLVLVDDLLALQKRLATPALSSPPDPALASLLAMERERLLRQIEGENLAASLKQSLRTLRQPLYPYQIEGVRQFLLRGGRLLLADDMGLGKTAQAIAACNTLWQSGRVRRGLIIMPASLKSQWLREWRLFCDAPIAVVEGSPAQRTAAYRQPATGFLIVNYEQVLRDLPLLRAFAPELVVLDEAQRIKNWATKTATCIKTLEVPYRLVLTGTPMENRLDELASLLEWVDPLAIEPKWRLGPWHSQHGDAGVTGARNLDTLRQRLAGCMLRRVRQDVLKQLPARTDTRIPVEMTPQQREEHDALNQPIAQLIAILSKRPLSPAQHLRLMSMLTTQRIISNGLAQLRYTQVWPMVRELQSPDQTVRDGLFSPKLSVLRDLFTQLVVGQGRKVVVFSQWRRMLRLAEWAGRDVLAQVGARAVFFTGGQSAAMRTQAIVEFHDDPDVRVMYLTDAGGVGLNLQRVASACINLELPWNPAVLEQRISRIYRIGQKLPLQPGHRERHRSADHRSGRQ